VVANVVEHPKSFIRTGHKVFLINSNSGWGSEKVQVLLSKSRKIYWVRSDRLYNVRTTWVPETLRSTIWTSKKEHAEQVCSGIQRWNKVA